MLPFGGIELKSSSSSLSTRTENGHRMEFRALRATSRNRVTDSVIQQIVHTSYFKILSFAAITQVTDKEEQDYI